MGVKFTEEQQAVIDARDANILVSAAAGSGKTAVLVERIIQMISSDMDIDHLLVVTFTKAAAAQSATNRVFATSQPTPVPTPVVSTPITPIATVPPVQPIISPISAVTDAPAANPSPRPGLSINRPSEIKATVEPKSLKIPDFLQRK